MAQYLAMRIRDGKLSYQTVFAQDLYKQFQPDVNRILTDAGRQDLIV